MQSETVSVKEHDYLDEDKPIRSQNYVLLSFISPEDVIVNKEAYYFARYMDKFGKDMTTLFEGLKTKFPDAVEMINTIQNNHNYITDPVEMDEQYKFFKSVHSSDIESDYHRDNNFQTTMRGIKVRGTFDTVEEAKNRSEFLKKIDDKFDIFIAQVGCWCPWSPNPNDLQNQEYGETQLNTLMKKYKENMDSKDEVFEQRKQDAVQQSNKTTSDVDEITTTLEQTDPWTERKEAENEVIEQ